MICLALTGERVDQLGLAPMAESNPDEYRTAYTVSVDAIAALRRDDGHQRAGPRDDDPRRRRSGHGAGDLRRGGHVFPLRARDGGVLQRVGHTEAAVDLARLAGLYPAGVDLRDPQRGRHDGEASAARGVRAGARAHVHHRRAARRAPAARTSGSCIASPRRACRPTIGDVARRRLQERRRHARARRARLRRRRRRRERARAHALEVPHRRRLPLAALRLRLAARHGDGDDRRRRAAA